MSFPNMEDAFWGWTQPVALQAVAIRIVDYQQTETPTVTEPFDGVLEPVHPRSLIVKPEGQRAWKWWDLWTKRDLDLNQIVLDGSSKQFRVMTKNDWSGGGYRHYELVQSPAPGS